MTQLQMRNLLAGVFLLAAGTGCGGGGKSTVDGGGGTAGAGGVGGSGGLTAIVDAAAPGGSIRTTAVSSTGGTSTVAGVGYNPLRFDGIPYACVDIAQDCGQTTGITPCPSGYNCDMRLTRPECVVLNCLPQGAKCSSSLQCAPSASLCLNVPRNQYHCAAFTVGDIGATCYSTTAVCKSGLVCTGSSTCQLPGDVGAVCGYAYPACKDGLYCGPDAQCVATGDVGASCSSSTPCKTDLYCGSNSKCAAPGDVGVSCSSSLPCKSSLACVMNGICAVPGGVGWACGLAWSTACMNGMYCSSAGKCTPSDIGAACTPSTPCQDNLLNCYQNKCVVRTPVDVGGNCYSSAVCKPGLMCDSNNQCVVSTPVDAGASCSSSIPCKFGLFCGADMRCTAAGDSGATCDPSVTGADCKSQSCVESPVPLNTCQPSITGDAGTGSGGTVGSGGGGSTGGGAGGSSGGAYAGTGGASSPPDAARDSPQPVDTTPMNYPACAAVTPMSSLPCTVTVASQAQTTFEISNLTAGRSMMVGLQSDSNYSGIDVFADAALITTLCTSAFDGRTYSCAVSPSGSAIWVTVKNLSPYTPIGTFTVSLTAATPDAGVVTGTGGTTSTGGTARTGGATTNGGSTGAGGSQGGATTGLGGTASFGGATSTGGVAGTGGPMGTGGASAVQPNDKCGNGLLDMGELCDCGTDTNNLPTGCKAVNGLFFGDGTGCTKTCTKEPVCQDGSGNTQACTSACGDGNIDPGEDCDDGNRFDGDGCSSSCKVEAGFTCSIVTAQDSSACQSGTGQCLELPVVYRDFQPENVSLGGHPDFYFLGTKYNGSKSPTTICVPNSGGPAKGNDSTARCWGIVASNLSHGKPQPGPTTRCACQFSDWNIGNSPYIPGGYTQAANDSPLSDGNKGYQGGTVGATVNTTSTTGAYTGSLSGYTPTSLGGPIWKGTTPAYKDANSFKQWFNDDSTVNTTFTGVLEMASIGTNIYQYASKSHLAQGGFFPLDTLNPDQATLCDLIPYWNRSNGTPIWTTCTGDQYLWPPNVLQSDCPNQKPLINGCWVKAVPGVKHDFYFTAEARYYFVYDGTTGFTLQFYADGDLFIFINGVLVLDLGGVHAQLPGKVTVTADPGDAQVTEGGCLDTAGNITGAWAGSNACSPTDSTPLPPTATTPDDFRVHKVTLGLNTGKVYEIAIFGANRHPPESNIQITLSGYTTKRSNCQPD